MALKPRPSAPLETLVSGLVPLSGDALKTLTAANGKDDAKTELSEEELAGLSALMAMLPHQQTTASRAAGSDGVHATRAEFSHAFAKRCRTAAVPERACGKPC